MAEARKSRVTFDALCCVSPREGSRRGNDVAGAASPSLDDDEINGTSMFEFPAMPPDIVVGTSSPDIPRQRNQLRDPMAPAELSVENGVHRISGGRPLKNAECFEAFYGVPVTAGTQLEMDDYRTFVSVNAGDLNGSVVCGSTQFQKDSFFVGGDTIRTDAKVGEGKALALYQTARFGNFSYKLPTLKPGDYIIILHLAEIVFTNGPAGMRVFDIFIQGEKVVSGVDIYAQVGSNQPLIFSDLRASVSGDEGLTIRFEGVMGNPLVCGISIRSDISTVDKFNTQPPQILSSNSGEHGESYPMAEGKCSGCKKLRRDHDLLCKEQTKTKRDLEDARKETKLKSKECYEAWMSLQELQTELMRKSMHVGSLAFAVEGQVKEKTRWFSVLEELSEKFKLLKLEHVKLSSEASEYKRCLLDMASEYKRCLLDMASITATVQSARRVNDHSDLEKAYIGLKGKFMKESKGRKELYNKVLELKGNIRVFCRCRPLHPEEISRGDSTVVDFEFARDGELAVRAPGGLRKVLKFDCVFGPQVDQETVFENASPFATSVLDGYNVCIFAYGQTGTGKTFTMEGTKEARGVNYRTLEELFRIIKEREGLFHYETAVSVLEVYNEQIRDLLLSGSQPGVAAKRLEIKQVAEGIHHVPGLVEARVSNMNEVWEVLQTGSNARAVGATNCNEHSSRSHCIHCVMVKGENVITGECTRSKLWLIDLAGSERVAKTDVQGDRLKEAQNINKSLSALGDVISALATKSPHVPFRNSKLTHLLQDSLGGDSKALMFVQISPNENDIAETLCSLNFASRVRGIELGPAKKQFDSTEASKCKHMLEKAKQEIRTKEEQMKKMEETVYCLESKMKAKDLMNKNLQDRMKELESQLLIERKLARQHVDTKIAENQLQKQYQHPQAEQESCASFNNIRSPLTTRPLFDPQSNIAENAAAFRDVGNEMLPNTNQPSPLPPANNIVRYLVPLMKENKPELADVPLLPRKASRVSISTTKRTSMVPAPRRNSLIPVPAIKPMEAPLSLFTNPTNVSPPLAPPSTIGEGTICRGVLQNQPRSAAKRFGSILRRSLQKRVIIKSPLHQYVRRGNNMGEVVEKAGVSVGETGRKARRVMINDTTRADREQQQHKWWKEKERGWNHGRQ